MAAPVRQAEGSFQSGGAVQLTVPWPTHVADDIGLLVICSAGTITALTTASGFVEITGSPQSTTALFTGVYWCRATSAAMASVVTGTGNNNISAVIVTARGCITTGDPWDVISETVKGTTSTSTSLTGDTTTDIDRLVYYIAGRSSDFASAQWSGEADSSLTGLTERIDNGTITGNGGGIGIWTGTKATAGAYGPMTATLANTSTEVGFSIALKPPASGATGTIAVTEQDDTSAITAVLTLPGTVAATEQDDTSSISGIVANPITGTIGTTEGNDTSAIAGVETLSGSVVATEQDDTSAISGVVANPIVGTIAVTEQDDTSAIAGDSTSPAVNGSVTVVEQDDTANFTGTVIPPAVTGTIGATEADDTSNFAGFSTVPGTMVVTEQNDTATFTGTVANPVTGTSITTEADDVAAFVGLVSAPGTIATTEQDDTANFVGMVAAAVTGTIDGLEADDTANFVGNTTGGVVVALKASSVVSSWPVSSTVGSWLVTSEVE